jgi:CheY-like chemotaxis protein
MSPGTHKILLIEDSMTIRFMYRGILENAGFVVFAAENGGNGLKAAKEKMPDIILLDLLLPDMHGLEVLKAIRANPATKSIPVVILTNLKEMEEIQKAISLGANYYGYKGQDSPQKIVGIIQKILEKKDAK